METEQLYAAFVGTRRVAAGPLRDVLPVLKKRFDADHGEVVLIFDEESGRQVDFDLRGSLDDILEREAQVRPQGPGRPRLGVVSREVSLFPRHWVWLEQQPGGISGALRRLVEQAKSSEPGKDRARRMRAALSSFLTAMAGDLPHYEDASRALFAGDAAAFEGLVKKWPKDVREYAVQKSNEAAIAETEGAPSAH